MKKYVANVVGVEEDYAYTEIDHLGSVTFSLNEAVWKEEHPPVYDLPVVLGNIIKSEKGYRALWARRHYAYKFKSSPHYTLHHPLKALYLKIQDTIAERWDSYSSHADGNWEYLVEKIIHLGDSTIYPDRGICIALIPNFDQLLFSWIQPIPKKSYVGNGHFLPIENFSGKLLLDFQMYLGEYYRYAKEHSLHPDILSAYNTYMLRLMRLLPYQEALSWLDKLYELNDIQVRHSLYDPSGYNPFGALLCDPEVETEIKVMANATMQDIVQNELAGHTKPRTYHEDALLCYSEQVTKGLKRSWENMSEEDIDLLINQVSFILRSASQRYPHRYILFQDTDVLNVLLDIIHLRELDDLYSRLSSYVLESGFEAFYDGTGEAARKMLQHETDPEYKQSLRNMMHIAETNKSYLKGLSLPAENNIEE